jgi:hypothetical protein
MTDDWQKLNKELRILRTLAKADALTAEEINRLAWLEERLGDAPESKRITIEEPLDAGEKTTTTEDHYSTEVSKDLITKAESYLPTKAWEKDAPPEPEQSFEVEDFREGKQTFKQEGLSPFAIEATEDMKSGELGLAEIEDEQTAVNEPLAHKAMVVDDDDIVKLTKSGSDPKNPFALNLSDDMSQSLEQFEDQEESAVPDQAPASFEVGPEEIPDGSDDFLPTHPEVQMPAALQKELERADSRKEEEETYANKTTHEFSDDISHEVHTGDLMQQALMAAEEENLMEDEPSTYTVTDSEIESINPSKIIDPVSASNIEEKPNFPLSAPTLPEPSEPVEPLEPEEPTDPEAEALHIPAPVATIVPETTGLIPRKSARPVVRETQAEAGVFETTDVIDRRAARPADSNLADEIFPESQEPITPQPIDPPTPEADPFNVDSFWREETKFEAVEEPQEKDVNPSPLPALSIPEDNDEVPRDSSIGNLFEDIHSENEATEALEEKVTAKKLTISEPPPEVDKKPPSSVPLLSEEDLFSPHEQAVFDLPSGTRKVTVHFKDGVTTRGIISNIDLDADLIRLTPSAGESKPAEDLLAMTLKTIFVLLPQGTDYPEKPGRPVEVTLVDDRTLKGTTPDYDPGKKAFTLFPEVDRGNIERIIIYNDAVSSIDIQ